MKVSKKKTEKAMKDSRSREQMPLINTARFAAHEKLPLCDASHMLWLAVLAPHLSVKRCGTSSQSPVLRFSPVQTLEIDSVRTVERRKLATAKSIPHRIYQTGRFRAVPYRQCGRRQPFALELHQLLDAAPLR